MNPGRNFCNRCKTATIWKRSVDLWTRCWTNTRPGEPTQTTRFVNTVKCSSCGKSVTA